MSRLEAVDLFAGTGWGVACKALGIDEVGVEKMPEARATRKANDMTNWLEDVWDVLEHAPIDSPEFSRALLIASPPCQTFSMAGGGAGRKALDEVLGLIDSRAYFDVANLRAFGERHDMRTALVLTPLAYVAQHAPRFVVLEQVPQVLPVWERMATEMRRWGYSVVTGVLNAEQYGVPQTRKRAILIARADGIEARMPTPTHSRYYSNEPTRPTPPTLTGSRWSRIDAASFARWPRPRRSCKLATPSRRCSPRRYSLPSSTRKARPMNNPDTYPSATGRESIAAEYRALGLPPRLLERVTPRFAIRRLRVEPWRQASPWIIGDRLRPSWTGRAWTHAEAIAAIDEILRGEAHPKGVGLPWE